MQVGPGACLAVVERNTFHLYDAVLVPATFFLKERRSFSHPYQSSMPLSTQSQTCPTLLEALLNHTHWRFSPLYTLKPTSDPTDDVQNSLHLRPPSLLVS